MADEIPLTATMLPPAAPTRAARRTNLRLQNTQTHVQEAQAKMLTGEQLDAGRHVDIISHRTMLRQTGRLCQTAARTMQRWIWALLKTDRAARIAQVGAAIEAKLAKGDVQEAFRCL
jgi:hypothetical protein